MISYWIRIWSVLVISLDQNMCTGCPKIRTNYWIYSTRRKEQNSKKSNKTQEKSNETQEERNKTQEKGTTLTKLRLRLQLPPLLPPPLIRSINYEWFIRAKL